jgi:Ca2+-binding EF-hand superfamily protein
MGQAGSTTARPVVKPELFEAMKAAFSQELGKGKFEKGKARVNEKTFVKVMDALRKSHPDLVPFPQEITPVAFAIADTKGKGKVDVYSLMAALQTFGGGDLAERATLVFKTIDKDQSGTLTRQEVRRHAEKMLALGQMLVTGAVRAGLQGFTGKLAATAIDASMATLRPLWAKNITADVLVGDTDKDGLVSLGEWQALAKTSSTVACLCDPNLISRAWETLFPIGGEPDQVPWFHHRRLSTNVGRILAASALCLTALPTLRSLSPPADP